MRRWRGYGLVALALVLTGCGAGAAGPSGTDAPATATTSPADSLSPDPTGTAPPAPTATAPSATTTTPSATPSPTTASPAGTAGTSATPRCPSPVPERLSLRGEQGRAFAFAPLDDPGDLTVEGEVGGSEAWSTSKVLVVAAVLDTVADGDPDNLSADDRRLVTAALTASDGDAVSTLRQRIPGSPGRAMTRVLRSIGDERTTAPDRLEGTMRWSLRAQVRFLVALQAGEVVSARASAYLLRTMRPIRAHAWGLGEVGATAYKGGWLRQGRVTRQLGLLDGYAVAIITDRGPVVRQTDGDSAHVAAMDDLARLLADRLALDRRCR